MCIHIKISFLATEEELSAGDVKYNAKNGLLKSEASKQD